MTTQTLIRMVLGLGMTAVVGAFAARRVLWLYKLVRSGQPASGRTDDLGDPDLDPDRRGVRADAGC